jgi:hypothetical protein
MSFLVYTVGLPMSSLTILVRHRAAIFADQSLRCKGRGDTPANNPNFKIRKRYEELCVRILQTARLKSGGPAA